MPTDSPPIYMQKPSLLCIQSSSSSSGAEGVKTGVQMHLHDWLPEVRLGYQGVSYWVVPWGVTQAKAGVEAGVEAEPDDGR